MREEKDCELVCTLTGDFKLVRNIFEERMTYRYLVLFDLHQKKFLILLLLFETKTKTITSFKADFYNQWYVLKDKEVKKSGAPF